MGVSISTGGLKNLTSEQEERIQNQLLQSVVKELGLLKAPDWTKITFSRVGPPHEA